MNSNNFGAKVHANLASQLSCSKKKKILAMEGYYKGAFKLWMTRSSARLKGLCIILKI